MQTVHSGPQQDISQGIARAFQYMRTRQCADGCMTDNAENRILDIWDSVHALRAHSIWQAQLSAGQQETLGQVRTFLRSQETAEGLLSWGDREPGQYSAETSSEYLTALIHLGEPTLAAAKIETLHRAQLPTGAWREHHRHIPEVFQTMPSVTAFVLRTFCLLDMVPRSPETALEFLLTSQNEEGHWGYNWYYNAVPYYVTMPVTDVLARFSCYAPLAKTRDYVLQRQRPDGSWFFDMAEYTNQLSAVVHTVYALETLLNCGLDADDTPIARGFRWLLAQQRPDGSWAGGVFPYPPSEQYRHFHTGQDVYGTAAVLVTLHRYLEGDHACPGKGATLWS